MNFVNYKPHRYNYCKQLIFTASYETFDVDMKTLTTELLIEIEKKISSRFNKWNEVCLF